MMYHLQSNLSEIMIHRRAQIVHSAYLKHAGEIDEACFPGIEVAMNAGPVKHVLQGLAAPIQGLTVVPYGEFTDAGFACFALFCDWFCYLRLVIALRSVLLLRGRIMKQADLTDWLKGQFRLVFVNAFVCLFRFVSFEADPPHTFVSFYYVIWQ